VERQVLNSHKTYEDDFYFYFPFENDLFSFFIPHVPAFFSYDIFITKVAQVIDIPLRLFCLSFAQPHKQKSSKLEFRNGL